MNRYTYTEQELRLAVKSSRSIRQVLLKLGIIPAGGNYSTTKQRIAKLGIDTSHFKNQAWSKGLKFNRRNITTYLTNGKSINSHRLRLRLLNEDILPYKCSNCGLKEWLNKPIPLELEHKDGNRLNNLLENLCLLCPNCHALTPTYRGRNASKSKAI